MKVPALVTLTAGAERRCPRRMPDNWQPPVPAFTSPLAALESAVVCSIGVQAKGGYPERPLRALRDRFASAAARVEQTWHTDAQGFRNDVLVCYFPNPESYRHAENRCAAWWEHPGRLTDGVGYWRETFTAPHTHRETLFSANDRPAGLATLASSAMLGPVAEHGYWGGARDRMPASAYDEFLLARAPVPSRARVSAGGCVSSPARTSASSARPRI